MTQNQVAYRADYEVENARANPAPQLNLGTPLDWNNPNTANSEAAKQLKKQMKNSTGWENDINQKDSFTTSENMIANHGGTQKDYVESQSNTGQNRYATSVENSSANKPVGGFLGNNGFSANSGPGHSLI